MCPHPAGEERLIRCPSCTYAASAEWAKFRLPSTRADPATEVSLVPTPDCATIADVAAFVGVSTAQALKAVFYTWERSDTATELVFVLIRGDLEVSEAKLTGLLGGGTLRAATDDEIRAASAEPGYASPLGLAVRQDRQGAGVFVVGDRSIESGGSFVVGANRPGHHLTGVQYPRDFAVTLLADVARAREGHPCPRCGEPLIAAPAIELGRCSNLGARYAEALGAVYLDHTGQERPVWMAAYSIDIGRLLAVVIEAHHDEQGVVWPAALAPFDVHLITLAHTSEEQQPAQALYGMLQQAGLAVLYDDRNERAGVKFNDADLIGCPVRVTVSQRSSEAGGVEFKARRQEERQIVALEDLESVIRKQLAA